MDILRNLLDAIRSVLGLLVSSTLLRFVSLLLLLLAAVTFATDLTRVQTGASDTVFMPAARHWQTVSPNSLTAARKNVSSLHPVVWDYAVAPVLRFPAWMLFGALGVAAGYAGRHRRRVKVFTN